MKCERAKNTYFYIHASAMHYYISYLRKVNPKDTFIFVICLLFVFI